jgi:hypothetical protein
MAISREEALRQMRQELDAIAARNRAAFEGEHADDLHKLLGLSQRDLNEIIPQVEDKAIYSQLIDVVKEASAKNLAAAALKDRIEMLGSTAVSLAKRAGILAGIL